MWYDKKILKLTFGRQIFPLVVLSGSHELKKELFICCNLKRMTVFHMRSFINSDKIQKLCVCPVYSVMAYRERHGDSLLITFRLLV